MTIAITGASGQLGRLAIQNLKTRTEADNIVALARSPEKVADLGVQARAFDYNKPETLAAALDGVKTLALISSSEFGDRVGQHTNVINAAKAAGVERIIYTSIVKCDASPMLIAMDHKGTEAALTASGMTYTLLRNNWYTENWTASLPMAIEHGAIIGSAGDGKVTPTTRQDLAEALAAVAVGEGHENKTYELACDDPFTMADLAAEASRQTGKSIVFNNLPKEKFAEILDGLGLPPGFGAVVADADANAAKGWLFDDSKTLSRLIGRPTTSLKEAVAAALG
ncbi:MAG: SDR family oxidoreductase [Sediminimonas sp.]|uniref:SDR family oxidoreductase n=1 Tax=Sediminimonas sp. TaxID=2823379 RepID=UPI00287055AC|nr:SDR family oxidoreductase [Sediminimonas sp.]MDR9483907.1 SDR family oxidoreductase [Sediminimonas sp.]